MIDEEQAPNRAVREDVSVESTVVNARFPSGVHLQLKLLITE